MHRRRLLAACAASVGIAGCTGTSPAGTDTSGTATPSPSETGNAPSPGTPAPTDRPVPELYVNNGLSREVVVSVTILTGRGRYREDRDGYHTVTAPASPTETPTAIFSDTATIPPDVGTRYTDLPAVVFETGPKRLTIDVEHGPNGTYFTRGWGGSGWVTARIEEETIRFGTATY